MNQSVRGQLEAFQNGSGFRAWEVLGARFARKNGRDGVVFRTWAPAAKSVSVVGDFCGWNRRKAPMKLHLQLGVWEAFVPGLAAGVLYKYSVEDMNGTVRLKSDPFALQREAAPELASQVADIGGFRWSDKRWLSARAKRCWQQQPVHIYEVHPGFWRRDAQGQPLDCAELGKQLAEYARDMGYTHVELMPVVAHADHDRWGCRVAGYFAPAAWYDAPHQLMSLVNALHKAGVGVILDWSPAYFPDNEPGLGCFDGAPCYEYADPLKSESPLRGAKVFDFSKPQVQSFLISSALFWLEQYHIDGLRLDAVASMLYLDFERGAWMPNILGGRENLEAAELLKKLNTEIAVHHPGAITVAEESASYPMATKPPHAGGLGFSFAWHMGWSRDMMDYLRLDPLYRAYNHDKLTFNMFYAFNENYILPLCSDRLTSGKGSLLERMPGDYPQKFAGVRTFLGYMMAHPGKKLSFMGCESGQLSGWQADAGPDWSLLDSVPHRQLWEYARALNHFYLKNPPLWQVEDSWDGFKWIVPDDSTQSVVVFRRLDEKEREILVVVNFAPVRREGYRFGVPQARGYGVIFSSEEESFGGGGRVPDGEIPCEEIPMHGLEHSISLDIPPMCALFLRAKGRGKK